MEDICVFKALTSPKISRRRKKKMQTKSRSSRKFCNYYIEGDAIGIGTFASVHRCIRRSDLTEFAVKTINKKNLTSTELYGLKNEIKILRNASHPNIIKLADVFYKGPIVSMVLELCDEHDLFEHIMSSKNGHLTERKSAEIVYTLCDSIQYLHEMGVVHRDLKPENILFAFDGTLKITDFGLAHYTPLDTDSSLGSLSYDEILMESCCGTPYYVAPEVITVNTGKYYNCKCDMWSLGVMIFMMLVGYQPFTDDCLKALYSKIASAKYDFNDRKWQNISKEAKHLISCLLELDPNKRYSPQQVRQHKWITKHVQKAS